MNEEMAGCLIVVTPLVAIAVVYSIIELLIKTIEKYRRKD